MFIRNYAEIINSRNIFGIREGPILLFCLPLALSCLTQNFLSYPTISGSVGWVVFLSIMCGILLLLRTRWVDILYLITGFFFIAVILQTTNSVEHHRLAQIWTLPLQIVGKLDLFGWGFRHNGWTGFDELLFSSGGRSGASSLTIEKWNDVAFFWFCYLFPRFSEVNSLRNRQKLIAVIAVYIVIYFYFNLRIFLAAWYSTQEETSIFYINNFWSTVTLIPLSLIIYLISDKRKNILDQKQYEKTIE